MISPSFFPLRWNYSVQVFLVIIIFTLCGNVSAQKNGSLSQSILINKSRLKQNYTLEDNSIKGKSVLTDLRDDVVYLFQEPDFYLVIGGMTLVPKIYKSPFENESPEISELWGPSKFADHFFELGEGLGSAIIPLTASALILTLNRSSTKTSNLKSFGSDLFRAHIFNGLITLGSKGFVNRTRPNGGPYSYPSGHTSTAFTSAGVIYNHFGPKFGIPAYVGAVYVGFSRLQENMHFISDVVAGATLGTYIAYKITHRKDNSGRFNIAPGIVKNSPGVNISFRLM